MSFGSLHFLTMRFLVSFVLFANFSVIKDHRSKHDTILLSWTLSPSALTHLMYIYCIYKDYSLSRTMEQAELTNGAEGMQRKVT